MKTDPTNPVHIAALELSEKFEDRLRGLNLSSNPISLDTRTYTEVGSDDEMFIVPSDESSVDERPRPRKKQDASKNAKTRCVSESKCKGKGKDNGKGNGVDCSDHSNSSSDGSSSGDDDDDDAPEYRIQYILSHKTLFPFEWQKICDTMNTREVTRGSVWQQVFFVS